MGNLATSCPAQHSGIQRRCAIFTRSTNLHCPTLLNLGAWLRRSVIPLQLSSRTNDRANTLVRAFATGAVVCSSPINTPSCQQLYRLAQGQLSQTYLCSLRLRWPEASVEQLYIASKECRLTRSARVAVNDGGRQYGHPRTCLIPQARRS